MVYMADSERAAELAHAQGLPVGLHLNLYEPFSGLTGPRLRLSQERVCRFLHSHKYALLLYHPLLVGDFARVVEAQLAEFRRLYGREPEHIDGHHHMHLCTNVLRQGLLPEGVRVRRSFSFAQGEKSLLNRRYRAWVDRRLGEHHRLVDHFFSLSQLLDGARLHAVTTLGLDSDVELMTHPAWSHEYKYLMGDAFAAVLQARQVNKSAFA
jgi:predicted glycoside hydrolase/deacetylase ChbG (UPF0249 family)